MQSSGNCSSDSNDPENVIHVNDSLFSEDEVHVLLHSWRRAVTRSDIGADLVARLLNDNRSLFKSLLATRNEKEAQCDEKCFTTEIIRNGQHRRACAVADGVNKFFSDLMEELEKTVYCEAKLMKMSKDLGARHYRMKVWFQAENWLCVKKSIVQAVLSTDKRYQDGVITEPNCSLLGSPFRSKALKNLQEEERIWFKLVQYVIRNMKQGFLEEAMKPRNSVEKKMEPRTVNSLQPKHLCIRRCSTRSEIRLNGKSDDASQYGGVLNAEDKFVKNASDTELFRKVVITDETDNEKCL